MNRTRYRPLADPPASLLAVTAARTPLRTKQPAISGFSSKNRSCGAITTLAIDLLATAQPPYQEFSGKFSPEPLLSERKRLRQQKTGPPGPRETTHEAPVSSVYVQRTADGRVGICE